MNNNITKLNIKNVVLLLWLIISSINFMSYAVFDFEEARLSFRIMLSIIVMLTYAFNRNIQFIDIFLSVIGVYLILINGAVSLNIAFLIISGLALREYDKSTLYKYTAYMTTIIGALVCTMVLIGIVDNTVWQIPGRTRYLLGFTHPNYAGILLYSYVVSFVLYKKQIKVNYLILFSMMTYLVFSYTNYKGAVIAEILFFLFYFLLKRVKASISKIIAISIVITCFMTPIMWHIDYFNNNFFNTLLSLRPLYFREYILSNEHYNLFIGGSKIFQIDNFYLLLLYNCGIFIYGLFFCLFLLTIYRLVNSGDTIELSFYLATLVIGAVESFLLRPEILCMFAFWQIVIGNSTISLNKNIFGGKLIK